MQREFLALIPPLEAEPRTCGLAFSAVGAGAALAEWRDRQAKQAALSTSGRLVVLDNRAHYVPLLQPELVTSARTPTIGLKVLSLRRRSEGGERGPDGRPRSSPGEPLTHPLRESERLLVDHSGENVRRVLPVAPR